MKRVLVTGMSGTGKSTVVRGLRELGHAAVDLDEGYCVVEPDGTQRWDEAAVAALLDRADLPLLFVAGCEENMGSFLPRFDTVILLTAPRDVVVERVLSRTDNPFGKTADELARILADLDEIEPRLRAVADHEIVTTIPLSDVVDRVLATAEAGRPTVSVREARPADWDAIWPFFEHIVQAGETYAYPSDLTSADAEALWMAPPPDVCFVAEVRGRVVGSAKAGPNRPGRGAHVATASFMVDPVARGWGAGRRLAEHVLAWAAAAGFRGMQFNAVVETNTAAVELWRSLGFVVVGTVPEAFDHARLGLVGLHVMYRPLQPGGADVQSSTANTEPSAAAR